MSVFQLRCQASLMRPLVDVVFTKESDTCFVRFSINTVNTNYKYINQNVLSRSIRDVEILCQPDDFNTLFL